MFAVLKLNFKTYNFNTKSEQGNALIFDIIRKKYVKLTPEEWVRQHFIHYLIEEKQVPMGLISIERALTYNGLLKRFDICVSDSNGKMFLLIECKAPNIKLSNQTLMQAGMYQKVLNVKFICISNGLQHIFIEAGSESQASKQIQDIPSFGDWLK